jgi:peptide/nickel transport system ATP-binding protein
LTASLHVANLSVTYPSDPPVRAVSDLSFSVGPGECLGVLGESGSGKSTIAKALLGMAPDARVEGGMRLGDLDLSSLTREAWRDVRWRRIALSFQSTASLNPVLRVGMQLAEPLQVHLGMSAADAEQRADELLTEVSLGDWATRRYPSELSGGQRRLVLLAIALACGPEVLLLDEPTAGLDGVTRTRVLQLLTRIRDEGRTAIVLLGHDVDTLEVVATQTAVLYRGWLAERGPAQAVLSDPRSPYSWALINARATLGSIKELRGIRGEPPDPTEVAVGCPFLARCTQAVPACEEGTPPLVAPPGEGGDRLVACTRGGVVSLLSASHLRKEYESRSGVLHRDRFLAVDDVGVDVREGEVVGIVGGTGAGKSTLAMLLLRVLEPDGGTITLEGRDLLAAKGKELKAAQRRAQIVFQDPFEALSPRLTIAQAVREPLDVQGIGTPEERDAKVVATLQSVRLPSNRAFLDRHTHELSGGQLQRVALARALVLDPKLLVADEPVSMLDPSEGVRMLELLKHLKIERGLALVIVSHDIATVLRIADRVLVIDQGQVVEEGAGRDILLEPKHPVTCALLVAAGGREVAGAVVDGPAQASAPAAVA